MQNMNGLAVNEGTALRELSLEEAEMVGGGFSWGGLLRGVEHFGHDVAEGMAVGFVGGAFTGPEGAILGSFGGAAGGALYFLRVGPGF